MSLLKTTPVVDGAGAAKPVGVRKDNDRVVKHILTALALVSVAVIIFIIAFIVYNSLDVIAEYGILDFIFGTTWVPTQGIYGAAALILGTILVTLGAMVICIPLGIAAAIFLSEIASERTRNILKPICEIFAGIPSVIFGFIGLMVIVPLLIDLFPEQASGSCWLAASIILGIMAMPTVMSVSDDALKAVPHSYREASMAIGATKWETIRKVVFPAALSGISAAIILGMGRVLGETMAVIMVAGGSATIPEPFYNIFSTISTLTAAIALEMPDIVVGSTHYSALFFLALLLMVIVVAVNLFARYIIDSSKRKMGLEPKKKRFDLGEYIPDWMPEFWHAHKSTMFKAAMVTVFFVFITLILSLFVSMAVAALSAAAVMAAYLLISAYMSRRTNPRLVERISFAGLTAAVVLILAILVFIIYYIVSNGIGVISWDFLTSAPSRGGTAGGIGPAIMGTIELIVGTAVIALPLGIITGVWLSMYSSKGKVTSAVRHAIDALNGTPSIVFGLFGLAVFVVMAGWGASLLAGCITLAFMILPVIIRTTEEAVGAVPHELLEASMAMGASKWQSIVKVILPAAMGGIVTGSILGLGRAAGETAPIMFTAAVSFVATTGLRGPFESVMALPYHLYYLAMEVPGSTGAQFGTALVLLILVLVIFGAASLLRYRYSKNLKW